MTHRWLVVLGLMGTVAALPAQETARVFGLNLFALPMDVQLGEDGAYLATGLFSRDAAQAALVPAGEPRAVLFRRAGLASWSRAKGPDTQPWAPSLEAGATYVLVVRPNGNGDLVRVDVPATPAAKVLFVNAGRGPAAFLDLGVRAENLPPGWLGFVDGPPGSYTLSWAWPTMPPGTAAYLASSAQPGKPAKTNLVPGGWFVAVVSGSNGAVTDITP